MILEVVASISRGSSVVVVVRVVVVVVVVVIVESLLMVMCMNAALYSCITFIIMIYLVGAFRIRGVSTSNCSREIPK